MSKENKEKRDCDICCNLRSNFVSCPFCHIEACEDCHQKFILEKVNPKCMNCNKDWTYNYVRESFNKNFINKTYKNYKEQLLLEQEKSLLPELQNEVAFEKKYLGDLELIEEIIKKLRKLKKIWVESSTHVWKEILDDLKTVEVMYFLNYKKDHPKKISICYQNFQNLEDKRVGDLYSFSFRNELRRLESEKKRIMTILKNKVDYKVLENYFGRGYHTFNISYSKESNTIYGECHFRFNEEIWVKINMYFKKRFGVNIKTPTFTDDEHYSLIFSIFYDLDINQNKDEIVVEVSGDKYPSPNDGLKEFFKVNIQNSKKKIFSRPCPVTDCRGFFGNEYLCGLCQTKICEKCHEPEKEKEEGKKHICNPNTIANLEMLKRDSKPCPKCSASIFKISGCDQIWCTQCHTAFSWKTGEVETGRIHNPHYWEFLEKIGKDRAELNRVFGNGGVQQNQANENECFTFDNLEKYIGHVHRYGKIFQKIYHLEEIVLPKFRVENLEELNKDLRKSYLMDKISEKEFKSKLIARFKKNNYNVEITQILEMFIQTVKDTYLLFFLNRDVKNLSLLEIKYTDERELLSNLKVLQDYMIKNIEKTCKVYDYVIPNKVIECLKPTYFDFLNSPYHNLNIIIKELEDQITFYENGIRCLTESKGSYDEIFNPRPNLLERRYFSKNEAYNAYKTDKIIEFGDEIENLKNILSKKLNEYSKT